MKLVLQARMAVRSPVSRECLRDNEGEGSTRSSLTSAEESSAQMFLSDLFLDLLLSKAFYWAPETPSVSSVPAPPPS